MIAAAQRKTGLAAIERQQDRLRAQLGQRQIGQPEFRARMIELEERKDDGVRGSGQGR